MEIVGKAGKEANKKKRGGGGKGTKVTLSEKKQQKQCEINARGGLPTKGWEVGKSQTIGCVRKQ